MISTASGCLFNELAPAGNPRFCTWARPWQSCGCGTRSTKSLPQRQAARTRQRGDDADDADQLFRGGADDALRPVYRSSALETRHDIDVLQARFGASFEQVAHRLTTLQRPGTRALPFFLLRMDAAGNVSKRFSAGGFSFSRYGGACPAWSIVNAPQTSRQPGRGQGAAAGRRRVPVAGKINPQGACRWPGGRSAA